MIHYSILTLFMLCFSSVHTDSSNVINKNRLKEQCDFYDIMTAKFTVAKYDNNPSKFKYVYYSSINKDSNELNIKIDKDICEFSSENYKLIAFKTDDAYFSISNIEVFNDYTYNYTGCISMDKLEIIINNMCIVNDTKEEEDDTKEKEDDTKEKEDDTKEKEDDSSISISETTTTTTTPMATTTTTTPMTTTTTTTPTATTTTTTPTTPMATTTTTTPTATTTTTTPMTTTTTTTPTTPMATTTTTTPTATTTTTTPTTRMATTTTTTPTTPMATTTTTTPTTPMATTTTTTPMATTTSTTTLVKVSAVANQSEVNLLPVSDNSKSTTNNNSYDMKYIILGVSLAGVVVAIIIIFVYHLRHNNTKNIIYENEIYERTVVNAESLYEEPNYLEPTPLVRGEMYSNTQEAVPLNNKVMEDVNNKRVSIYDIGDNNTVSNKNMVNRVRPNTRLYNHINQYATKNNININNDPDI